MPDDTGPDKINDAIASGGAYLPATRAEDMEILLLQQAFTATDIKAAGGDIEIRVTIDQFVGRDLKIQVDGSPDFASINIGSFSCTLPDGTTDDGTLTLDESSVYQKSFEGQTISHGDMTIKLDIDTTKNVDFLSGEYSGTRCPPSGKCKVFCLPQGLENMVALPPFFSCSC